MSLGNALAEEAAIADDSDAEITPLLGSNNTGNRVATTSAHASFTRTFLIKSTAYLAILALFAVSIYAHNMFNTSKTDPSNNNLTTTSYKPSPVTAFY
jgi:hypothetical protein